MSFMLKFCLTVIISSVLIGCAVFLLSYNSTTVAIENTKVIVKPTSDFILPGLSLTVFIVSVSTAVVMLFLTLLITHRIAGPIFRFKKEIELIKEGDMSRHFGVRRKDQFQELAVSLNEMTKSIRHKNEEINKAYSDILQYLQKKDFCISQENKEEFNAKLAKMDAALNRFKAE